MYQLTVDYSQSLEGMIKAGKYDWVNSNITRDNFPTNHHGMQTIEVELIHFGKELTTQEIEVELENQSLRPATLKELLAFGAKYPDKQREYSIVALGSGWVDPIGRRYVPYLVQDGDVRDLNLSWDDPYFKWEGSYRFLAVSKTLDTSTLGSHSTEDKTLETLDSRISLLDHFAGLAMQAIIGNSGYIKAIVKNNKNFPDKEIAKSAYEFADLMIEERNKRV